MKKYRNCAIKIILISCTIFAPITSLSAEDGFLKKAFNFFQDPFGFFLNKAPGVSQEELDALQKEKERLENEKAKFQKEKDDFFQSLNSKEPPQPTPGAKSEIANLLSVSPEDITERLDSLRGSQYGNFILADQRATQRFIRRLFNAIRDITVNEECDPLCMHECRSWGEFGLGRSCQRGETRCNGYDMHNFNITLGAQRCLNDWLTECELFSFVPPKCLTGWTVGAALSYEYEHFNFNPGGKANMHNTQGAIYALVTGAGYYAFTNIVLGYNTGKFDRPIHLGFTKLNAHSSPGIFQISGSYELGLNGICLYQTLVQPFVGIESGYYSFSSIKEKGAAPLNLKISGKSTTLTNTRLGVHLTPVDFIDCSWLFALDLAWNHLFSFKDRLELELAQNGRKLSSKKADFGQNGFEFALTVDKAINDRWNVYGVLSGERWKNYSNFDLRLGSFYFW